MDKKRGFVVKIALATLVVVGLLASSVSIKAAATHEVSFNLNGGSGTAPAIQMVEAGTLVSAVSNPTKDNSNFLGWNTQADGKGVMWNFGTSLMPDSNLILFAAWEEISIFPEERSVVFDLNGGVGNVPPTQKVYAGEQVMPVAEQPTKDGYNFKGWNTLRDGTGKMWDFAVDPMVDRDIVLYAAWEKILISYEVSFDLNGASGSAPVKQTVVEGGLITAVTVPTRTGYDFLGWNTQADGNGVMWDFATSLMPTNNLTLFASWEITPVRYTVTFNLNGATGTAPAEQRIEEGKLVSAVSTPVRNKYQFNGWNTMSNGKGTMWDFSTSLMPSENIILYAIWEYVPSNYTVSFNLNGAAGDTPAAQTILEGQLLTNITTAPTRVGYAFLGWSVDQKATASDVMWDFSKDVMLTKDFTLYAVWQRDLRIDLPYILRLDLNGVEGLENMEYTVLNGKLILDKFTVPNRAGYNFMGWNTMADGSGKMWNFEKDFMPDNDFKLYAIWEKKVEVTPVNVVKEVNSKKLFTTGGNADFVIFTILFSLVLGFVFIVLKKRA